MAALTTGRCYIRVTEKLLSLFRALGPVAGHAGTRSLCMLPMAVTEEMGMPKSMTMLRVEQQLAACKKPGASVALFAEKMRKEAEGAGRVGGSAGSGGRGASSDGSWAKYAGLGDTGKSGPKAFFYRGMGIWPRAADAGTHDDADASEGCSSAGEGSGTSRGWRGNPSSGAGRGVRFEEAEGSDTQEAARRREAARRGGADIAADAERRREAARSREWTATVRCHRCGGPHKQADCRAQLHGAAQGAGALLVAPSSLAAPQPLPLPKPPTPASPPPPRAAAASGSNAIGLQVVPGAFRGQHHGRGRGGWGWRGRGRGRFD